jgi:seryl-tRNA synthetase
MFQPDLLDRHAELPNVEGTLVLECAADVSSRTWDVEREAERRGWVTRFSGVGQYGIYSYQPPMAALILSFKDLLRRLALQHGFQEMIFPRHYRAEALSAFGWTEHEKLKHELMVLRPLNPDVHRINYELLVDPLQCVGFYETLRIWQQGNGGVLPPSLFENGGLRVFEEQGGWTLRNEEISRLKSGFATSFEFGGAELVWAGMRSTVYATRWEVLTAVCELLSELQLHFRVVVGSSCSANAHHPELLSKTFSLYEMPTLDMQLRLPATIISTASGSWAELGGGDVAGTRLTGRFGLKTAGGAALYSGCQGIGWQRLAYGFLAQKGFQPEGWPPAIQTRTAAAWVRPVRPRAGENGEQLQETLD